VHDILFDYARYVKVGVYPARLADYIKNASDNDFVLPKFLNRYLATMFLIVSTHFITVDCNDCKADMTFRQMLAQNTGGGAARNHYIGSAGAERIITGNGIKVTKAYKEFRSELEKIKSSGRVGCITYEEYKELSLWGEGKLGLAPRKWLQRFYPFIDAHNPKPVNLNFAQTCQRVLPDADEEFTAFLNRGGAELRGDIDKNIDWFKGAAVYWDLLCTGAVYSAAKSGYYLVSEYLAGSVPDKYKSTAWTSLYKFVTSAGLRDSNLKNLYKLPTLWCLSQLDDVPQDRKALLLRGVLSELGYDGSRADEVVGNPGVIWHELLLACCREFINRRRGSSFDYRDFAVIILLEQAAPDFDFVISDTQLNDIIAQADYPLLVSVLEHFEIFDGKRRVIFNADCAKYLLKYGNQRIVNWYFGCAYDHANADEYCEIVCQYTNMRVQPERVRGGAAAS
jgi:hypothetical protein